MSGLKVLAGFFISGFVLALPGVILPAWGYHRDPPAFAEAGHFFLCLALGLIVSTRFFSPVLRRQGLPFLLVFSCALACAALAFLALVGPPAGWWWRGTGFFVV